MVQVRDTTLYVSANPIRLGDPVAFTLSLSKEHLQILSEALDNRFGPAGHTVTFEDSESVRLWKVPVESYVERRLEVKQGDVTLHEQKVRVTKANIGELSSLRTDSSEWPTQPSTREDIWFSVTYWRHYECELRKGEYRILVNSTLIPVAKAGSSR
jgi:hypothetical protein